MCGTFLLIIKLLLVGLLLLELALILVLLQASLVDVIPVLYVTEVSISIVSLGLEAQFIRVHQFQEESIT